MKKLAFIIKFSILTAFVACAETAFADETCEIIESAMNFRFAQEDGGRVCGIDAATNKKLCLKKGSKSYFVSTDAFQLKPVINAPTAPKLYPVIELGEPVKDQVEETSRQVSMNRTILDMRDKVAKAKSEDNSYSNFLIGMVETDHIAGYYERRIKLMTKKHGPGDTKVIDLEKAYAGHKMSREEAMSKTAEELASEVAYADQLNFGRFNKELQKNSAKLDEINRALSSWSLVEWLNPTDCKGKITPNNSMLVKREDEFVVVQTGKIFQRSTYKWRPKSFHAHSVGIHPTKKYAFIQVSGHDGGSIYRLGQPFLIYMLEKLEDGWRVIAASGTTEIFY